MKTFKFRSWYYCPMDLKRQSEHSKLRPDTSSLVNNYFRFSVKIKYFCVEIFLSFSAPHLAASSKRASAPPLAAALSDKFCHTVCWIAGGTPISESTKMLPMPFSCNFISTESCMKCLCFVIFHIWKLCD